jgi:repressor LexA
MKAGEFLKEYRKSKKWRAVDLAEKLYCSQVFISNIENGKRKIPDTLLEQLKKIMDSENYDKLANLVILEKSPQKIKDEFLELKELKTLEQKKIPYFSDIQASAGFDCYNNSATIKEYIEVPKELAKKHNIAITVNGDSMEPEIKNNDIIIVDTCDIEQVNNKIVVINYKDVMYLKKIVKENNDIFLVSINPYYPKIKIKDKEDLKIIGRLISVIRKY